MDVTFCTPAEVVKLIGREGEPVLLTQAETIIEIVSMQVDEMYGPFGEESEVAVTLQGTHAAALFPGRRFSTITKIERAHDGIEVTDYSHHNSGLFRAGGWFGPHELLVITGDVSNPPSPAVCSVVRAVCGRMLLNPVQAYATSHEAVSVTSTIGLTMFERRVLDRWRLTSTWPRGNP